MNVENSALGYWNNTILLQDEAVAVFQQKVKVLYYYNI